MEDTENHVFWGAQIAHNASWQMELYRKDDGLALGGGLADRDFGHWMKNILPGQTFETPEAIVSCAHTDSLDLFTGRLTEAAKETLEQAPESEQDLPIIFNEYCTTWGNPSHENIKNIVDRIRDRGFTADGIRPRACPGISVWEIMKYRKNCSRKVWRRP